MWSLLIGAGLDHIKSRRETAERNRQADREHKRAINQHIIEGMAIENKWRNSAADKAIIADRDKNKALERIAEIQYEVDSVKKSTVNQIRQYDVAYIKGGYSEQSGRRAGRAATDREVLLSQTGERVELAQKLAGKKDRAALLENIAERQIKQADYDWDRSVNAARPGGRHLPPHPGYTKGPSFLDTALNLGTSLVDRKMNRDRLARERGEKPVFSDNWFG